MKNFEQYEKISNDFYIHMNPETKLEHQKEWEIAKGRKVKIKGFEDYDFLVHEDIYGNYVISEGLTGMKVPLICEEKQKEAIESFKHCIIHKCNIKILLEEARERMDKAIKKGILIWGLSPRYKLKD